MNKQASGQLRPYMIQVRQAVAFYGDVSVMAATEDGARLAAVDEFECDWSRSEELGTTTAFLGGMNFDSATRETTSLITTAIERVLDYLWDDEAAALPRNVAAQGWPRAYSLRAREDSRLAGRATRNRGSLGTKEERVMRDTTLELTGTPIQQLALDWASESTETIAVAFQQAFTQASILPNQEVLRELRQLSESTGFPLPLALMTVNHSWSVYAVGPRWFAVHTDIGEVVAFSDLVPEDIDRMGIHRPVG